MSNLRYGDARYRQSRIQARRNAEAGSGRRRLDPSIHATSRPYHTSTAGIRMSVTQNSQLAAQMTHPTQQRYLNAMRISEKAQMKVNRAEEEMGRQYDTNGLAMLRGLQHSQGRGMGQRPGEVQSRINEYRKFFGAQEEQMERRGVGAEEPSDYEQIIGSIDPKFYDVHGRAYDESTKARKKIKTHEIHESAYELQKKVLATLKNNPHFYRM